mmetsp:Transcript_19311/g.55400  ORF Transcript_19311/g.55400 Transcript_19311/m.55400 type:complete len:370 (-) Transcript_19311:58-1167(-)
MPSFIAFPSNTKKVRMETTSSPATAARLSLSLSLSDREREANLHDRSCQFTGLFPAVFMCVCGNDVDVLWQHGRVGQVSPHVHHQPALGHLGRQTLCLEGLEDLVEVFQVGGQHPGHLLVARVRVGLTHLKCPPNTECDGDWVGSPQRHDGPPNHAERVAGQPHAPLRHTEGSRLLERVRWQQWNTVLDGQSYPAESFWKIELLSRRVGVHLLVDAARRDEQRPAVLERHAENFPVCWPRTPTQTDLTKQRDIEQAGSHRTNRLCPDFACGFDHPERPDEEGQHRVDPMRVPRHQVLPVQVPVLLVHTHHAAEPQPAQSEEPQQAPSHAIGEPVGSPVVEVREVGGGAPEVDHPEGQEGDEQGEDDGER